MALHFIALLFSACSLALLIISNLGTTFNNTFLPNMYLIQINQAVTGNYIRYGVYNSCLYQKDIKTPISCTAKKIIYEFDAIQFAEACGADMNNTESVSGYVNAVAKVNFDPFRGIILIMISALFSFISFTCTLFIRKYRDNNTVPFIGAFSSLLTFFSGAAGLALAIATFWKALAYLEKVIEGLSHVWGPSIYLIGIGTGCILITLISFIISLFTYSSNHYKRETFNLYDHDLKNQYGQAISSPIQLDQSNLQPSYMYRQPYRN